MKKNTIIILLLILVLTTITGCGDSQKDNSQDTGNATTQSAVTSSSLDVSGGGLTSTDPGITDSEVNGSDSETDNVSSNKESKSSSKSDTKNKSGSKGNNNTGSKSSDGNNTGGGSAAETSKITCSIGIDCKTALKKEPGIANSVSNNGVILSKKTITLEKDASVYDALKASGIKISGSSYITSINSLSEGDCGRGSGWMFNVNGTYVMKSSKKVKLKDNDHIQWRYTCDSGADIGASTY